jgi:flagellar assembly factor FliW
VLYELRSVEKPDLRFLVGVPRAFFPEYTIELDDQSCDDLELHEPADALVLVILSAGSDATTTTANLLAPVVINASTRSAAQVILSGTDWPVRALIA